MPEAFSIPLFNDTGPESHILEIKKGINIQIWNGKEGSIARTYINFLNKKDFIGWYKNAKKESNRGYFEVVTGPQKIYMDMDCPKKIGINNGVYNQQDWE